MAINTGLLDLAFALDCTSSMGSYIDHAKQNINRITDEIIKAEKCQLRLALVEYRDHPPEDRTFITRVNDFTDNMAVAKTFINRAAAHGGGDLPESICCALADSLNKLKWRDEAVKILILIADAPPHGIYSVTYGDRFKNGCPTHNDPIDIAHKMAEKGITLYSVGCEPSLTPYREFFIGLSLITGGQYVPLDNADNLSVAIIGGAREEISMEKIMAQIHNEVLKEAADKNKPVDEEELTKRIHAALNNKGVTTNKLKIDNIADIEITERIKEMSKLRTLKEVNEYMSGKPAEKKEATKAEKKTEAKKEPETKRKRKTAKTKSPSPEPEDKPVVEEKKEAAKVDEPKGTDKKATTSAATETASADKRPTKKAVRRSTRLAFNSKEDALKYIEETGGDTDIEDEDEEEKEIPKKKPNLTKSTSSVSVSADEKIDVEQVRRLVKKSIARNKLNVKKK